MDAYLKIDPFTNATGFSHESRRQTALQSFGLVESMLCSAPDVDSKYPLLHVAYVIVGGSDQSLAEYAVLAAVLDAEWDDQLQLCCDQHQPWDLFMEQFDHAIAAIYRILLSAFGLVDEGRCSSTPVRLMHAIH
ncbi:hypothetical protein Droror1_Dr00010692 [Drosera rotundifolia]